MMESSPESMASAQVVSSVSLALRDIIVRGLGDEHGIGVSDVSLVAPGEEEPRSAKGFSLFVYHLRLGSEVWPRELAAADAASLQLELCYMVLPHAPDARSEQRLSAALAGLFHAFATIHVAALPDSSARSELLASKNQRLRLVAQYPEMDVIRRLWSGRRGQQAVQSGLYYRVLPVILPAQSNDSLHRLHEMVAEKHAAAR